MQRFFSAIVVALIASVVRPPDVVRAASADPASTASAAGSTAPDYTQAANWICRPGNEATCTQGLDATIESPRGPSRPSPFVVAEDPPIDCFYVYPTVSQEQTTLSDLAPSPEVRRAVHDQAGRLTSRCRLFAPIYRQQTIFGLQQMMSGEGVGEFDTPLHDVAAAWASYLAHDNHGRGVVLVGHSQGTILLQSLIASTIDGTPQQRLLVSAFLAGDPSLAIPRGKRVGGTFAHVPLCATGAQIGCAYAWGSYLSNDTSPLFTFGAPLDGDMVSACNNPAAPGGGTGMLAFFHKNRDAAAGDPPWIETVGQLAGTCHTDATGSGFIVTVLPGNRKARYTTLLENTEIVSGWGLHLEDVPLVQGNMLDVLDAEIATWIARRP